MTKKLAQTQPHQAVVAAVVVVVEENQIKIVFSPVYNSYKLKWLRDSKNRMYFFLIINLINQYDV